MAILRGTSQTRFPRFDDPNSGIGAVFDRAQESLKRVVNEVTPNLFRDTFVEDGAQNIPGLSLFEPSWSQVKAPTRRTILTQRPKATVFVKKRMFSTLRNNFDIQFMGKDEKLFLRAVKNLFRRKSQEIAFYENLISIERIFDNNTGFLNINEFLDNYLDSFLSLLSAGFGLGDDLGGALGFLGQNGFANNLEEGLTAFFGESEVLSASAQVIQKLFRLREINKRSKSNMFTTWIVDELNPDFAGLGPGTGTIEFNLVSALTTKSTIKTGGGGCSLTIEDPYRLTLIDEADIELALRQAIAEKSTGSGAFDFTGTLQLKQAEALDRELNASRRARGVSEINFEYIFGTDNKAQGIVVETRETFNQSNINEVSQAQALTAPETIRAFQIIDKMESFKAIQERGLDQFHLESQELNPARIRMRKEFLGHSMIQQMDSVHVFVNGQTRDETPVYSGKLDTSPAEFVSSLQQRYDAISSEAIYKEWEVIGDAIPFALYSAMRNPSFFRGDGVSTFAGLVTDVKMSYSASNGKFVTSVTCKDNIEYLKISRINTNPSLLQPQGILEDPITPFDLNTDSSSGLLKEAPELSEDNKKRLRLLRFDDGDNVGERVGSESNLFRNKSVLEDTREILEFDHVPGLIYSWKEGIVSATLNINGLRTPSGRGSDLAELQEVFGITVLDNPFGNLDAADIVSILISGRPHNYSSFLDSVNSSGTFSRDSSNNSRFYFNFLFDFLDRQRQTYGNFIPAKPSVIDPKAASGAFKAKLEIDGTLRQLAIKRRRLAELEDRRRAALEGVPAVAANLESIDRSLTQVNGQITDLKSQIEQTQARFSEDVRINIFGNQAHINIESDEDIRGINRRLSYRLKRKPEEVRYNQDNNFLIVSDQYDVDTDIQAFVRNLKDRGPNLFSNPSSDYKSPFDIVSKTAQTIDFELFADPDGNIQFRPPQYNKTPLSLLLKLIDLANGDQTVVLPTFLLDLFQNRLSLLENDLLIRDLELLESFILLGEDPDGFGLQLALRRVLAQGATDSTSLFFEIDPQVLRAQSFEEEIFSPDQIANNDQIPTENTQFNITYLSLDFGSGNSPDDTRQRAILLAKVRNQLADLTGRESLRVDVTDGQFGVNELISEFERYSDRFNDNAASERQALRDRIASAVSERQASIKAYRGLVVQAGDLTTQGGKTFLSDVKRSLASWSNALTGRPVVSPPFPKYLEPLIENDLQNDDGFRSGKRFIIYDDVIESMELSIHAPEYNRVDVQGNVDLVGDQLRNAIPLLFWAGAVDFDSWRQFGFRTPQQFTRPDFSDPESQCAPYAVFKLLQQRRNIHKGTIAVVGNEFYRPGDVVFINSKNMLYYVEDVDHSLSFGDGRFTTRLTLTYGHPLGDYIPTPLDVIGKGVLSNKKRAFTELKSNRNSVPQSGNVVPLQTLFAENYPNLSFVDDLTGSERTTFLDQNRDKIKNAIVRAASKINNNNRDDFFVEIRTYYISQLNTDLVDNSTFTKARILGGWVASELVSPKFRDELSTTEKLIVDRLKKVKIDIAGDLTDREKNLRRFPTSQAWTGAERSGVFDGADGDRVALPVNAIDIVFVVDKSRRGDRQSEDLRSGAEQLINNDL